MPRDCSATELDRRPERNSVFGLDVGDCGRDLERNQESEEGFLCARGLAAAGNWHEYVRTPGGHHLGQRRPPPERGIRALERTVAGGG